MEIQQIQWLWLILPIAVLFLAWYLIYRGQWASFRKYFGDRNIHRLLPGFTVYNKYLKMLFLLLGMSFLLLALANPRVGLEKQEVETESVNVLLAVDLSYSMTVEDRSPNRLEIAKQRAIELIDLLPGNSFAFFPFAGVTECNTPITIDREAVKTGVRSASAGMLPVQGTSFANLLEVTGSYLEELGSGVLVVISDGETHDTQYENALDHFVVNNYPIFSVAIGTEEGAGISHTVSGRKELRRDINGNIIISRMELEHLNRFSNSTGGGLLVNPSHSSIQDLATQINRLREEGIAQGSFTVYRDYYPYLLGASLLFLVLYGLWPLMRSIEKKRNLK